MIISTHGLIIIIIKNNTKQHDSDRCYLLGEPGCRSMIAKIEGQGSSIET